MMHHHFHRVLAAVDDSPAAAQTLGAAARLAAASEATLAVLRVVEDPWRLVGSSEVEGYRRLRAGSTADLAAGRVRARLGELVDAAAPAARATALVEFGVPGVEIARWAELEAADLIVLGTRPHDSARPRALGPVLEGTLRRSRVPVLVLPLGQPLAGHVLAVVEDGIETDPVTEAARALAEPFGREAQVFRPEPALVGAGAGHSAGPGDAGAVSGILREVRDRGYEVVALGHHRGAPWLGHGADSLAARVWRRLPCGVLAVPA